MATSPTGNSATLSLVVQTQGVQTATQQLQGMTAASKAAGAAAAGVGTSAQGASNNVAQAAARTNAATALVKQQLASMNQMLNTPVGGSVFGGVASGAKSATSAINFIPAAVRSATDMLATMRASASSAFGSVQAVVASATANLLSHAQATSTATSATNANTAALNANANAAAKVNAQTKSPAAAAVPAAVGAIGISAAAPAAAAASAKAAADLAAAMGLVGPVTDSTTQKIGDQVAALSRQAAQLGMTAREAKLLQLAQKGATQAQIDEADAALRAVEAHKAAAGQKARATAEAAAAQRAAAAEAAANQRAAKAIDDQIAALRTQATTYGMSAREATLYTMTQRGATAAQLAAADAALKAVDAQKKAAGGISAGQRASAFGMLPAQITDVVTQLAGGQNPLLIMIQQGGQVKDSFGGIGNALKAVGSLLTPTVLGFGALAAVIGTVGYALYQNGNRIEAFNESIAFTGNYANQTASSLMALTRAVGEQTSSYSSAADAIAQIVGTGRVGAAQLEIVSLAAVEMKRATGQAVKDTVAEFVRLADDPVRASAKLNESMHYLTTATYDRIRALVEQGDKEGAAAVAQEAYAQAVKRRSEAVIAQLGPMAQAWMGVKDAAADAWEWMSKGINGGVDAIGGVILQIQKAHKLNSAEFDSGGANFGMKNLLTQLNAKIETAEKVRKATGREMISAAEQADIQRRDSLAAGLAAQAKLAAMEAAPKASDAVPGAPKGATSGTKHAPVLDAAAQAVQDAGIAASTELEKIKTQVEQKADKLETTLKKIQTLFDKKRAATPENKAALDAEQVKLEKDARQHYKTTTPKVPGEQRLKHATQAIDRDLETFGQSDDERKIIDLKNMGASAAVLEQYTAKLRQLQGLKDAKVRGEYEEQKSLVAVKDAQAEQTAAYETNREQLKAKLEAKVIDENAYNVAVAAARAQQIEDLRRFAAEQIALIDAADAKVKTASEHVGYERQRVDVNKSLAAAIRAVNSEAAKDDLAVWKRNALDIAQIKESLDPLEKYRVEIEKINKLRASLGENVYAKAMTKALNEQRDATRAAGKALEGLEDVAVNVAKSVQDNLGTATANFVDGKFADMGESFSKMASAMVATALQTNLTAALFGDRPGNIGGGGLIDKVFSIGSSKSSSGSGGGFLSSLGSWFSGLMSFDGGGSTGSGSRAGGVDGKGGFMAILHPDETVIDHTKGQVAAPAPDVSRMRNTGGGGEGPGSVALSVSVNVYGADGSSQEATQRTSQDGAGNFKIDVFLKKAAEMGKALVLGEVAKGGDSRDVIAGTFGLNAAAGARS